MHVNFQAINKWTCCSNADFKDLYDAGKADCLPECECEDKWRKKQKCNKNCIPKNEKCNDDICMLKCRDFCNLCNGGISNHMESTEMLTNGQWEQVYLVLCCSEISGSANAVFRAFVWRCNLFSIFYNTEFA